MMKNMWIGIIMGGIIFTSAMAISGTIYVDTGAGGSDTGDSWVNAFTNLQDGLAAASSGDEIWVAKGTYYPGTTRADTFQLISGVILYGGFISGDAFGDRDWQNNETILSGDIGTQGVSTDNSYHVITGTNDVNINGFSVKDGYADGTAPDDQGGGYTHPTDSAHFTIENCLFEDNFATNRGGALYLYRSGPQAYVKNCTFRRNGAIEYGGAIAKYHYAASDFVVSGCTFIENWTRTTVNGSGRGGAIYFYDVWPKITNCVFTGNSARYGGGIGKGSASYRPYTGHGIFNCIFSDNYAYAEGGGIQANGGAVPVKNCMFFGNRSFSGGGLKTLGTKYDDYNAPVSGCVFAGNLGSQYGGALDVYGSFKTSVVANCTFVQNKQSSGGSDVRFGGGAIISRNKTFLDIKNTIFQDNIATTGRGDTLWVNEGTGMVSYCDLTWDADNVATSANGGTLTSVIGNIDAAPLLGAGFTGAWTGNGIYDADTGQTTLTNNNANWTINEMVGMGLNPDTNSTHLQFYIAGNTAKAIQVWGDATEGISGDNYKVYDYRLQSGTGRWEPGTSSWIKDSKFSPCIDVGDPADDYSSEPDPNGDRINMGAFGGTTTASKTAYIGTVILVN